MKTQTMQEIRARSDRDTRTVLAILRTCDPAFTRETAREILVGIRTAQLFRIRAA